MVRVVLESQSDTHVWYIDESKKDRVVQYLLDIQEEE